MEQNQIDKWKEQYGKVFEAACDEEKAYFRKPNRKELSYVLSLQSNGKHLEMIEQILTSCFLGGSRKFIEDTDYMLGAAPLVEKMIEVKNVQIKNL